MSIPAAGKTVGFLKLTNTEGGMNPKRLVVEDVSYLQKKRSEKSIGGIPLRVSSGSRGFAEPCLVRTK